MKMYKRMKNFDKKRQTKNEDINIKFGDKDEKGNIELTFPIPLTEMIIETSRTEDLIVNSINAEIDSKDVVFLENKLLVKNNEFEVFVENEREFIKSVNVKTGSAFIFQYSWLDEEGIERTERLPMSF